MKNVLLTIVTLVLLSMTVTAQTKTDYSKEGYHVGCELAATYNVTLYNATIGNSNFPQEYLDAVRLGWANCPKPTQKGALSKESYQELIHRLGLYGSRLYSVIFVGGGKEE
ncbi:hypothetical protein [Flagellimonas olearia]|uniref:Uncharacterized protein n=1 Tax=Flagellimonas olearia TaxID=552546 RepID=A0A444VPE0_9FLAO|nr:hypothetical protein [Allomuricauda olearia]RYC52674.1 hypothetical protein DN53_00195 [Allomuricauda olearia]